MEAINELPRILPDKSGVAFCITRGATSTDCVVSIRALEDWFWLPPGAKPERVLAAFSDGYGRISAVAERRVRARSSVQSIYLKTGDFRAQR
ncbi:DUF1488 family protein [Paraburkholderia sp. J41]|uniref:DUF1488 family protein n=1 Tax=Paraburkholderia sp. J41 TaxID=2805433 RepID=UPI002AC32A0E|nr:DUF1488 family protein [Paraburkholderia sp. J41]